MAKINHSNPEQVVHPDPAKNIQEITGYLNLFPHTEFETVQDWCATIMDNNFAFDCRDKEALAQMLHEDGQTAEYLIQSHNAYCEDYGMPKLPTLK